MSTVNDRIGVFNKRHRLWEASFPGSLFQVIELQPQHPAVGFTLIPKATPITLS